MNEIMGTPHKTNDQSVEGETPLVTVAICSRNRNEVLVRCLNSLILLAELTIEVILVDDASESQADVALQGKVTPRIWDQLRIIRYPERRGYIPARNHIAREARGTYILSLDDDAFLLPDHQVHRAVAILKCDPRLGAIALAQTDEKGLLHPAFMQPSASEDDCYVAAFYGYGHLVRRNAFLALGGYREIFEFYREEIEFCKRLQDCGYEIVYLPSSSVVHSHDPAGRNELIRLRYNARNSCFDAIYNEPLLMLVVSLPLRLLGYFWHRKHVCKYYHLNDRGGFRWLTRQIFGNWLELWRNRRPLSWATFRRWRILRQKFPAVSDTSVGQPKRPATL